MNMKNFFKKLHITSDHNHQSEDSEGSTSSRGSKSNYVTISPNKAPLKQFSGFSGWFNSVTNRHNHNNNTQASSLNVERDDLPDLVSDGSLDVIGTVARCDSGGSSNSRDPYIKEEYQIQLALELSAREDPEAVQIEAVKQISLSSCNPENTPAELVAYQYWNYHFLSYDDKILDGFYDLYGVVTESSSEKMPSLVDLQGIPVSNGVTWEAVLVNRTADANLDKLEQKAMSMVIKARIGSPLVSFNGELVKKLAIVVSDYMGGPVGDPENMLKAWKTLSYSLKASLGSMVMPLGSLTVGLARHRALLFKVLADSVGIPCRLVKGHQYTGSDGVAMSLVKTDDGREYIVDLMADPGTLIPSDSAESLMENNDCSSYVPPSSSSFASTFEDQSETATQGGQLKIDANVNTENKNSTEHKITSNLSENSRSNYPYLHGRSPSWTEGVSSPAVRRMKVKDVSQYMIDAAKENPQLAQKLHDVLLESGVVAPTNLFAEVSPKDLEAVRIGVKSMVEDKIEDKIKEVSQKKIIGLQGEEINPGPPRYAKNVPVAAAAAAAAAVVASSMVVAAAKSSSPESKLPVAAAATAAAVVATTAACFHQDCMQSNEESGCGAHQNPDVYSGPSNHEEERVSDKSTGNECVKSDLLKDDGVSDCEIPWEEIDVGERIGLGSYGEVYRGDWHGTEVAIKKFLEQDISGESLEEFKSEVLIMKRLRHPNVVLFMGAVTRAPNLSIITEFLPRGSLYRLIHRPNNQLDARRRLRMALDAARGMNYLHSSTPVIVHRDLKSPNLLVDKNWVVKVCDFGLSRIKHNTYLSSRSTAGTAEWMAPEVLRNEPSDEKCDVFSYGVILWELCTLQQPWGGLNPMQVVGAVGFQHRRLDIPDDMEPCIADIIRQCWQTDPKLRPTFMEIMAALKPLQKPITSSKVPKPPINNGD